MNLIVPLIVIFIMVLFNALYVAAEFATVGSRKSRVQENAESGSRAAKSLLSILQDSVGLDNYVAACQVGITLSSLVAGAWGQAQVTPVLADALGDGARVVAVIIVLVGVTALQVVLGELLPKTVALRYPERLAMATLPPMRVSRALFKPLVAIFNGSANQALKRLGVESHGDDHNRTHTVEELAQLYRASAAGGLIEDKERDMLAGVLAFDERLAREIMTPRRRFTTLRADMTIADALMRASTSVHSRFPVEDESDEISSVVHLRDLFRQASVDDTVGIATVATPAMVIPEFLTVPKLWSKLRNDQRHLALIVNEYGSVAGLVTLEDVVEEIFGEVLDEFDLETEPISVDGERVSVRGDVLISAVNDRFDVRLPDVDVDTVGGLAWHELSQQPEVGDQFEIGDTGVVLRIDQVDGRAVERASFELPPPPDDEFDDQPDAAATTAVSANGNQKDDS